jgi:hypothetical protein
VLIFSFVVGYVNDCVYDVAALLKMLMPALQRSYIQEKYEVEASE